MKLCRLACLLFAAVLVTALALGGCTGDTPQDTVKITLEYIYWADGSEIAEPYITETEKNAEYDLSDKTGENARIKGYVLMSTEGAVSGTALGDTLVMLYYRTKAENPGEVTPTPSSARYFSVERDFFDEMKYILNNPDDYYRGNLNACFSTCLGELLVKGSHVQQLLDGEEMAAVIYDNGFAPTARGRISLSEKLSVFVCGTALSARWT